MPTPLRMTPRQAKRLQANAQPDRPTRPRRDIRADLLRGLETATGLRRRMLQKALAALTAQEGPGRSDHTGVPPDPVRRVSESPSAPQGKRRKAKQV